MNTDPNVAELWQVQEENENLRTKCASLLVLLRRIHASCHDQNEPSALPSDIISSIESALASAVCTDGTDVAYGSVGVLPIAAKDLSNAVKQVVAAAARTGGVTVVGSVITDLRDMCARVDAALPTVIKRSERNG